MLTSRTRGPNRFPSVASLREAASKLSSALLKQAHAAASGKPVAAPPLTLSFNRHTVDFVCGKTRAKLSTGCYGKLAILHRRNAAPAEACAAPPASLARELAGGKTASAEAVAAVADEFVEAAAGKAESAAGGEAREALHLRLFAMLLRYKALQGGAPRRAAPPACRRACRRRRHHICRRRRCHRRPPSAGP